MLKKIIFVQLLMLLILSLAFGNTLDSLKNSLKNEKEPLQSARIAIEISDAYQGVNNDSLLYYAKLLTSTLQKWRFCKSLIISDIYFLRHLFGWRKLFLTINSV
jgi:hypothetical protein